VVVMLAGRTTPLMHWDQRQLQSVSGYICRP
jgi:hypothetical protein